MGVSGCELRSTDRVYDMKNAMRIGLNSRTLLVIKLPDSRALRIISRSLLLGILLLTLPSIASIVGGGASSDHGPMYGSADSRPGFPDGPRVLPIILRDLLDEGLVKKGHKGFVLVPGLEAMAGDLKFLSDSGVDLVSGDNLMHDKAGSGQAFDFVFLPKYDIQMIDRIIAHGGLVIARLGPNPSSNGLRLPEDFRIVYLRRFKITVVAMRKIVSNGVGSKKVSCGLTPEKKEKALNGLEDVYLEPPRRAKNKSSFTSRKIKFLPNLLEESLDEYPRKVFISDDWRAMDWFYKNYPMRDQEFEVYRLGGGVGGGEWVRRSVVAEDYVVMKGEAGLVEEMLVDGSPCLVDELFMECKNGWVSEKSKKSERAYWQCLALHGRVRDEGIAVHQWW